MAELHDLSPSGGSHRDRKRLGRGPGSGTGKTAGRGQKGAGARAGAKSRARFEGGQMPLHRRLPKRGFTNLNRVEYQVVNLRDLDRFDDVVTIESLRASGLIGTLQRPVKVLGTGDLAKALKVEAHAFSKSAKEKIEAAGGSVSLVGSAETA
ncbi:MAG: 50S ribosomal protein L15 [Gemmatimonadetes bacterium]|nr:50S ribosomal protein L15 [Gemmatimonadota bacterium]